MSEYTLQHNCYIFGREASIHSTKNTFAIAFVQEYIPRRQIRSTYFLSLLHRNGNQRI